MVLTLLSPYIAKTSAFRYQPGGTNNPFHAAGASEWVNWLAQDPLPVSYAPQAGSHHQPEAKYDLSTNPFVAAEEYGSQERRR